MRIDSVTGHKLAQELLQRSSSRCRCVNGRERADERNPGIARVVPCDVCGRDDVRPGCVVCRVGVVARVPTLIHTTLLVDQILITDVTEPAVDRLVPVDRPNSCRRIGITIRGCCVMNGEFLRSVVLRRPRHHRFVSAPFAPRDGRGRVRAPRLGGCRQPRRERRRWAVRCVDRHSAGVSRTSRNAHLICVRIKARGQSARPTAPDLNAVVLQCSPSFPLGPVPKADRTTLDVSVVEDANKVDRELRLDLNVIHHRALRSQRLGNRLTLRRLATTGVRDGRGRPDHTPHHQQQSGSGKRLASFRGPDHSRHDNPITP